MSQDLIIGSVLQSEPVSETPPATARPALAIASDPLTTTVLSDPALLRLLWPYLCEQMNDFLDAASTGNRSSTAASIEFDALSAAHARGETSFNPAHALLERHLHCLEAAPRRTTPVPAAAGRPVTVESAFLDRHTVLFGATGGGKSYLSYVFLREQLAHNCSLVAFDPKLSTIRRLVGACAEARIPAERVVVIDPKDADNVPGFNPFLASDRPGDTVAQIITLIELATAENFGPRMRQFLRNALILIAWHRGSLLDVAPILTRPEERERFLATPPHFPIDQQYAHAVGFFVNDFPRIPNSDRNSSIQAVTNKFDELLGTELYRTMLCSRTNTIDLPSLFRQQGAVLVHMDSFTLGDSGVQLLSGIFAYYLQAAAMRHGGRGTPVVLAIDEAGSQSQFLSTSLRNVVNMAREHQLRLLFATQHPGQLSQGLREDLMASAAVSAYFRLKDEPARAAAQAFADATAPEEQEEADDDASAETVASALCLQLNLVQMGGHPVFLPLYAVRHGEQALTQLALSLSYQNAAVAIRHGVPPQDLLRPFVEGVLFQQRPVYLQDASRASDAIALLQKLPDGTASLIWHEGLGYIRVALPSFRASVAPARKLAPARPARRGPSQSPKERWLRAVLSLGIGEAIVQIADRPPEVMRVTHVSPPRDAPWNYVARSRAATRVDPRPFEMPVFRLSDDAASESSIGDNHQGSSQKRPTMDQSDTAYTGKTRKPASEALASKTPKLDTQTPTADVVSEKPPAIVTFTDDDDESID